MADNVLMPGIVHLDAGLGVYATLLFGEKRALLVDTGYGLVDLKARARAYTELPLTVILTHGHHDHALGAMDFDETFMFPADLPDLRALTGRERRARVLASARARGIDADEDRYMNAVIPEPRPLEESVIDLGGLSARVLRSPGHTPGSAIVYVPEAKLLLCGDNWNPVTWLFFESSTDVRTYRESFARMLALPFERVLCPHRGEVFAREVPERFFSRLTDEVLTQAKRVIIEPYTDIDTREADMGGGMVLVFDGGRFERKDTVIRIDNTHKVGVMDRNNAPAAYCADGDTVVFETMDCSDGAVRRDGTRDRTPGRYLANPATGPLYVNGAMPGDLLKVEILKLRVGETGYMGTGDREHFYKNIDLDYTRRVFDVSGGTVTVGSKTFPVAPMIGVIGVAPAGDGIRTMTPDAHGGNMDCTKVREGATVYFPVNVPGALLAMGDLHAAMGDGEVFLYGLETPGEVTVRVSVVKGKTLRMPVLTDDSVIAAIASADTLDEASGMAVEQLYDILLARGWDPVEAGYLMSLKCDLRVCQIVDPKMTVRAELALDLIDP